MENIGKNIQITVADGKATIVIDLTKTYGSSSSGKSIIVASTEGNKEIPGTDIKIGLNAYRSK